MSRVETQPAGIGLTSRGREVVLRAGFRPGCVKPRLGTQPGEPPRGPSPPMSLLGALGHTGLGQIQELANGVLRVGPEAHGRK